MVDFNLRVDLTGLDKMTKQWPEASAAARTEKITEASLLLERAVKLFTPEGAGPIHLRDTIFQQIEQDGLSIWGIVSTPAAYGEPVEMGTKPHFPPIEPIQHWVERILNIPANKSKAVAESIAWHIYHHGTQGAAMFQQALDEQQVNIKRILEDIPDEIIRRATQ